MSSIAPQSIPICNSALPAFSASSSKSCSVNTRIFVRSKAANDPGQSASVKFLDASREFARFFGSIDNRASSMSGDIPNMRCAKWCRRFSDVLITLRTAKHKDWSLWDGSCLIAADSIAALPVGP